MDEQQNIYICSTANIGDTRSRFCNRLPEVISSRDLYVALADFSIDARFITVLKENTPHVILTYHEEDISDLTSSKSDLFNTEIFNDVLAVTFESGLFENVQSFTNLFNNALAEIDCTFIHRPKRDSYYLYVGPKIKTLYILQDIITLLGIKIRPNVSAPSLQENSSIMLYLPELDNAIDRYISPDHGIHNSLYKHFDRNIFKPQMLKIYLNQIESQFENNTTSRLFCSIPAPKENNLKVFKHTPINLEYCKVDGTALDKCEVLITDAATGRQVMFAYGKSTFVKLDLKRIMSRSHIISVDSNDVGLKRIFTTNRNTKFSVKLPYPLLTTGKWQVSLLKMSHSKQLYNITDMMNTIIYTWTSGTRHVYTIEPGYYTNIQDIINQLNFDSNEFSANVNWAVRDGKVVIKSKWNVEIKTSSDLSLILGFSQHIVNTTYTVPIATLITYTAPLAFNLSLGETNFIRLNCEQVENSVFCEQSEPLIAFLCIASATANDKSYYYESVNPSRHLLINRKVERLDFLLLSENTSHELAFGDATPSRLVLQLNEV